MIGRQIGRSNSSAAREGAGHVRTDSQAGFQNFEAIHESGEVPARTLKFNKYALSNFVAVSARARYRLILVTN
jgi:hypothetical protein